MAFGIKGSGTDSLISQLGKASSSLGESLSKISSGTRITKAADDAAGLAIAAALQEQAAVLSVAQRNVGDAESVSAIQDAVYSSLSDIGDTRLELSLQAANGTVNDVQRNSLNLASQQLGLEAQREVSVATFNGTNVFAGQSFQVGTDGKQTSQISTGSSSIASQVATLTATNIGTQGGAQAGIDSGNAFIDQVSKAAGDNGAVESRLSAASSLIGSQREATVAASSSILDADIGAEASSITNKQIQQQVTVAAISQNLKAQQGVLNLLA